MANVSLQLSLKFNKTVIESLVPSFEWAVECGLLTEEEAARAFADEIIRTARLVVNG